MLTKFKNLLRKERLNEDQTVELILKKIGYQIYTGPFAGLKIPHLLYDKMKLAEILGLYEFALHGVFSELINKNIRNIMVIGGHKGYYPAGLSDLLRPENLYVFEMEDSFLPQINAWIAPNDLVPYEMYGEATDEILKNWNNKIDFLLIDCEGAEDFLLNPELFKWQKNAEILVETHHFYNHKIMGNLISRFTETHDLKIIYDDIYENEKIQNILDGLNINGSFRGQPTHRWIFNENQNKIITSGIFLHLTPKNVT
jgi:hypothetical protein